MLLFTLYSFIDLHRGEYVSKWNGVQVILFFYTDNDNFNSTVEFVYNF